MTAIPEDVMAAAEECISNFDSDYVDRWKDHLCRSLMAERRRCALIARKWQESPHKDEKFAANSIADKIMAGAE